MDDEVDHLQPFGRIVGQCALHVGAQQRDARLVAAVEEAEETRALGDHVGADGGIIGGQPGLGKGCAGTLAQVAEQPPGGQKTFERLRIAPGVVIKGGAVSVARHRRQLQICERTVKIGQRPWYRRGQKARGGPGLFNSFGESCLRRHDLAA